MSTTLERTGTARPVPLMWIGLALTALIGAAPLVDIATADTIGDHVRAAYPDWSAADVRLDRNAIAIYLAVYAALGIGYWLIAIRAVAKGWRGAKVLVAAGFAVGALMALTNASLGGEAYSTIVPTAYGLLGLVPSIVGLAVLVSVLRDRKG